MSETKLEVKTVGHSEKFFEFFEFFEISLGFSLKLGISLGTVPSEIFYFRFSQDFR